MKAFAQRLKTLRKSRGLTLKSLAQRLEVSDAYISMLESGKRQPARGMVLRLAAEFGGEMASLRDELLILAGYAPENLARFEVQQDPLAGFQHALVATPDDFGLFQGYVQTLLKTGRAAEARAQIEQGFRRFADAFQLQCLLADLELARGDVPAARVAQQAALEQFRQAGREDQVLESLLSANLGGICFQLGMAQLAQGERSAAWPHFVEAEAHFVRALALDPANLFTRDEYARVCFNLADLADAPAAQAYWVRCLEAFACVMAADPKPGFGEAALRESAGFWAYAQAKCGQLETARQQLWVLTTCAPADWLPRYLLTGVELLAFRHSSQAEHIAQAAEWFRRSLRLDAEQTLQTGRDDRDLALLRERHPELFERLPAPADPAALTD